MIAPAPAPAWWQSSASPEWYTPTNVIDAARRVLGGIDLDPASCPQANATVGALAYYTQEDDGLSRPWFGRVWMNPPFGRAIGKWTAKLRAEHEAERVVEAITLVPARVDTRWYRGLEEAARLTCHADGRIKFTGRGDSPPFPTAFFYLGADERRFAQVFRKLGRLYRRVTDNGTRCVTCDGPIVARRRDSRTCSPACRQRAYRQRRRSP